MASESLVTIVETPEFIRRIDKLMDDDERAALILYLATNPMAGDLIPGTDHEQGSEQHP